MNGLQQPTNPATLDGLNIIDADQLYLEGQLFDPDNYVPYTGATKTLNMGAQKVQSSATPSLGNDLVNLTTLTDAVTYIDTANALTYLNKITATDQTVAGAVTFNSPLTADSFYTDKSYNWGRQSASYNAWSIKRILNGGVIRDLQFRDETDSITTLLLSSSGQTVYTGLTCDYGTASKVPVWDANKKLVSSGTDSIKISYLDNVSSDIQAQINARATTTYVDAQNSAQDIVIATKASTSYVDTQLALKANLVGGNTFTGNQTYSDNTASTVAIFDASKNLKSSTVTTTTLGFLDATSSIQNQLNAKANTSALANYLLLTGGTLSGALTVDAVVLVGTRLLGTPDGVGSGNFWMGLRGSGSEIDRLAISIAGNIATGVVSGVSISKPLILSSLTADRALYLDGSKVVTTSATTSTELGYLSGVTSAIQTQLGTKASTTYVDTADGLRLLKAGDTASGTLYNTGGEFWPYKGGDVNKGCRLFANNADGATYATYNGGLRSWFGIGFECSNDSTTRFMFNTRDGNSSQTGTITCGGATISGATDITGQVSIGLNSNVTPNIKFANSLSHIDNGAGEAYLFTAYQGHISVGRNTNRDATTANLVLGTSSTEESEIISRNTNNTAYKPLSFGASEYTFTNGAITITNPGTGYVNMITAHQANLANGFANLFILGKNSSAYNTAQIQYTHISNGSTSNYGTLQMGGVGNILNWTGAGNVGIGITNPGSILTLSKAVTADNDRSLMIRYNNSQPAYYDWEHGPQVLGGAALFSIRGGADGFSSLTNFFNIDGSGNVGIGIIPLAKLTVNGNTLGYGSIHAYSDSAGAPSMIYSQNDTTGDGYAVMHLRNNSGTGCYWFLNSSGRTADGGRSTATLRNDVGTLRLQSSGGFGFQINAATGYTRKDGGDNSKIIFGPNSTWNSFLIVGAGPSEVSTDRCQLISTNGNCHIDSALGKDLFLNFYSNLAGNVGNTFSYGPWRHGSTMAVTNRLTVGADSSRTLMSVTGGSNGSLPGLFGNIGAWPDGANGCLYSQDVPTGANSGGFFIGYNSTGNTGYLTCLAPSVAWLSIQIWAAETYIYWYGALSAYTQGGGWINVSDEREKEDIQPLKTAKSLERILALKPKHYLRKYYDGENPVPDAVKQTRHVGFVAQEVQQSNPHCVSSWCNDKVKNDETEDDGSRLGMNYTDYTVHLVGAVQEQQKQLEVDRRENDELRKSVEVLEAREVMWEGLQKDLEDKVKRLEDNLEKVASLLAQLVKK